MSVSLQLHSVDDSVLGEETAGNLIAIWFSVAKHNSNSVRWSHQSNRELNRFRSQNLLALFEEPKNLLDIPCSEAKANANACLLFVDNNMGP